MATLASRINDLAVAIRTKINAMVPRLLPAGGADGAFLYKASATDYNVGYKVLGTAVNYSVGTSGGAIPLLNTANSWSATQTYTAITYSGVLTSNVATGTAPFAITSTTLVNNLNVQYLNGQLGSYYLDAGNLTGTLAYARFPLRPGVGGTYANATVTVNTYGIVTAIAAGTGGGVTGEDLAFTLGYI